MDAIKLNDEYQWVINIIRTSIHSPQLEICFNLISQFTVQYPNAQCMTDCLTAILHERIRIINGD